MAGKIKKQELDQSLIKNFDEIGDLSELETTSKDNLVDAINEVYSDSGSKNVIVDNFPAVQKVEVQNFPSGNLRIILETINVKMKNNTSQSYTVPAKGYYMIQASPSNVGHIKYAVTGGSSSNHGGWLLPGMVVYIDGACRLNLSNPTLDNSNEAEYSISGWGV
ncbi:hypothetical protein [Paenibacillus sp. GCM10027626]|uniref:hypothetical protein n=1 Tax=Paenibacillus sp. GCM10027626 TaxID=3273411 RepID=UPI003636357C